MENIRRFFKKLYRALKMAAVEFYRDDGFNLAAGLSFFAIVSVIPITLIVISIVGHYIGQSDQLFAEISAWVLATLPQVQPDFIDFLRQLVNRKLASGWVGIIFLFFVASFLFANIEHLLDKVLKSERKRNFWHSAILSIASIGITAVVLFALVFLKVLTQYFERHGAVMSEYALIQGSASYFIAHFLVFLLLLRFAPNELMRGRNIVVGGLVFGLLTVLASHLFRWYMGIALERYHFIYGSLTVLVLLVVWIYYLSVIFVFCGELVNALQKLFPQAAPAE